MYVSTKDFGENNGRKIAINLHSSGSAPERNLSLKGTSQTSVTERTSPKVMINIIRN